MKNMANKKLSGTVILNIDVIVADMYLGAKKM